jgi:hypothetical protein
MHVSRRASLVSAATTTERMPSMINPGLPRRSIKRKLLGARRTRGSVMAVAGLVLLSRTPGSCATHAGCPNTRSPWRAHTQSLSQKEQRMVDRFVKNRRVKAAPHLIASTKAMMRIESKSTVEIAARTARPKGWQRGRRRVVRPPRLRRYCQP